MTNVRNPQRLIDQSDNDEMNEANCRRKIFRQEGKPTFWDGQLAYEPAENTLKRHRIARGLCATCPAFDACRKYLEATEARGLAIDGVVAGRYSKVQPNDGKVNPAERQKW